MTTWINRTDIVVWKLMLQHKLEQSYRKHIHVNGRTY